MKSSLPLILAVTALTLSLNACNTLANRRDLYFPEKQHGPWTDKLNNYNGEELPTGNDSSNNNVRPVNH